MESRPIVFETNPWHSYASELKFAHLGLFPGTRTFFDSSIYDWKDLNDDVGWTSANWKWSPYLGRYYNDGWSATTWISTDAPILGTGPLAVSLWMRTSYTTSGQRVAVSVGSTGIGIYKIGMDDGRIIVYAGGANYQRTNTNNEFNDGEWHHITVLKPESASVAEVEIYVDGADRSGEEVVGSTDIDIGATSGIKVGTNVNTTSLYYVGDLADVLVWHERLLTISEIRDLADPSLSVFMDGFIVPSEIYGPAPTTPPAPTGNPWYTYAQEA